MLRFYVTNTCDAATAANLQRLIGELLAGDPEAIYFERLESHAAAGEADSSAHVGFLTMLIHYSTRLA
ncbi:MAG: hypothetical protein Kow0031_33130 [Anaerolineae bacterium]